MSFARSLVLVVSFGVVACSSDSKSGDPTDPYANATGGFPVGAGGAPVGGAAPSSGGAPVGGSSPSTGGAPDLPPGQLVCAGKPCKAGGHCTASGLCPAELGDCFSHDGGWDNCSLYCRSKGLECADQACGPDGKSFEPDGFTWVSYPAARSAECGTTAYPAQFGPDTCTTPIWLSPTKPLDDVVRCCCR